MILRTFVKTSRSLSQPRQKVRWLMGICLALSLLLLMTVPGPQALAQGPPEPPPAPLETEKGAEPPGEEPVVEPATALEIVPQADFTTAAFPGSGAYPVTIEAIDLETDNSVPDGFRFIINEDITHDNSSTTPPRSYSRIFAAGDDMNAVANLDNGRYLVTVLGGPFPAVPGEFGRDCTMDDPCGYKLGGAHFTVSGSAQTVTVELVPNPLPLATLRVRVFHDNNSVNGEDDIPFEEGIEGFPVVISDPTGEVSVDFFGNPLCAEYDGNGDYIEGTGGQCLTDADGYAVIPNLPPLKYEVTPIPPDGSGWIQTTTIEGTHANDAWLEEGASGFSTEEGFLQAVVWFGFVKECSFGDSQDVCPSNNDVPPDAGSISGRVRQIALDTEKPGDVTLGPALANPLVALNNIGGNDEQVYTGRGDEFGNFTIPNVPPGLYQLVYWDFPQLYIIQFLTVQVGPNDSVDVGDIGIPRWRGVLQGYAYIDNGVAQDGTPIPGGAENGFRDCYDPGGGIDPYNVATCEPGLPGQDLDVRQKDGTIVYTAFADSNGYYDFPDYFEWEHFLIWEIGFGRLKQVGTTGYFTEFTNGGLTVSPIGYPYTPENGPVPGLAGLLQAELTPAGVYQWFDTGKVPYPPGENGGLAGIVYHATTRNEFNPRLAAAEDYEPGIPNVTVNLYQAALDANQQPIPCNAIGTGCPFGQGEYMRVTDAPIDSVATDSWDDNLPTDCMYETPVPGSGNFVNDPQCLELPNRFRQIKDGVFDGGYAFEGTPAGAYIVEVDPPAGYRHIREEDQNTDHGDDFIPTVPPPECAGPLHMVNDERNPANGTMTPLCDSKFVRVIDGFNAAPEFFLMTDFEGPSAVPPPGLLRGLLLDDLTVQLNPASNIYLEKRGIPNTPVGILDFEGNEVAVVNSDADGYWEVLLPSSYTAHCPTPGGVCPGMYQVIGNYPGSDPQHPLPDWNPNYGTLRLVFDVWPGKTTYADVAIFPITGFVQDPGTGFNNPPVCDVPADTPDLQSVSAVYGSKAGDISFTITGANFDNPTVTLDGTPVMAVDNMDGTIQVTIPSGFPQGAHQLLVTNGNGQVSQNGITFHVLGSGGGPAYNPPIKEVGNGGYATIQDALDDANDGDLIVVQPGIYYENIIIYKNVKLQGYGPGAASVDGRFFNFGGLTPAEFQAMVTAINPVGPTPVPMGQTITVLATANNTHNNSQFPTQIDGFAIRGGSRVRGNVAVPSQGGGIYGHAFARRLQVSNNLIQSNAGTFGGGVILGQAYVGNSNNNLAHIHHNRVLNNGGVSLAGGIALFKGANEYEIDHNVVCGNYSGEYGGGISHFGMSDLGSMHDNQILYNYAFDEGGGIMIAGEQPNQPDALSDGSGEVLVDSNLIQGNVSNDDGGGIRMLQPVDGPVYIINNMVVNNLATDLGGGISLDDALDVRIVNNSIARNITTATAEDADRSTCSPPALGSCPHAAGISSEPHSQALRDAYSLPLDSFSDPLMFNNIIWENEAFYLDGTGGLPSAGFIDLEVVGTTTPQSMTSAFSIFSGTGPMLVDPINLNFIAVPFAGDPAFVTVLIISEPGDPQGDYHLQAGSPAIDAGAANFGGVDAPSDDFDGDARPQGPAFDIGADEVVVP
jgi:hypothetical protein